MGCSCHIVHNTAEKGSDAFRDMLKFDVDDLLVDIYVWFEKSTKRTAGMEEHQAFHRKVIHQT